MSIVTIINASTKTPLDSGVYIHYLRKVSMKAVDIKFQITTNINLTSDITTINEYVQDFSEFCNNKTRAYEKITVHCKSLETVSQENRR